MSSNGFVKVDLHLHADGSLPLGTIYALIDNNCKLLPGKKVHLDFIPDSMEGIKKMITVGDGCTSLDEYLKCFTLPLKLLQTPESMWLAGRGIAEELKRQNVAYAEIRFAPQLHSVNVSKGKEFAHEEQIIKSFIEGVRYATRFSTTTVNVLLCMMRNLPDGERGLASNLRTLYLAKEFLGRGVVGLDLAGSEARDETSKFEAVFSAACDLGIPFTIHAGEAGDDSWRVNSIERAIYFGAKRIGHGIALEKNADLRRIVRDSGIVVECCPISNLQTKAVVGGINNHPIKRFLDEGLKVTVNTDNMTVSNTDLDKEYEVLRSIGITDNEIQKMQENAIDGAFISESEKRSLKKRFKARKEAANKID